MFVWNSCPGARCNIDIESDLAQESFSLHMEKALRKIQSAFALRLKVYHPGERKSIGVPDKENNKKI